MRPRDARAGEKSRGVELVARGEVDEIKALNDAGLRRANVLGVHQQERRSVTREAPARSVFTGLVKRAAQVLGVPGARYGMIGETELAGELNHAPPEYGQVAS
jgi:hypothetical protein